MVNLTNLLEVLSIPWWAVKHVFFSMVNPCNSTTTNCFNVNQNHSINCVFHCCQNAHNEKQSPVTSLVNFLLLFLFVFFFDSRRIVSTIRHWHSLFRVILYKILLLQFNESDINSIESACMPIENKWFARIF